MANTLKYKAMILWKTARNKRELDKALKQIRIYGRIAINSGRIVGIDLKEMEDPTLTQKDRVALGLSGLCAEE